MPSFVTPVSALLLCVPMPNTSVPLALAAPVSGTGGNCRITPLLFTENFLTGLVTCCATGTTVPVQFVPFAHEKYMLLSAVVAQLVPQS